MIQLLATRYSKSIAFLLLIIFECSFVSVYGRATRTDHTRFISSFTEKRNSHGVKYLPTTAPLITKSQTKISKKPVINPDSARKGSIGGPSQPEMSSFKSVGTDNMVNLFTGDFSYNIPLLDVGGYPVNIFYDGGITPEQEASWVGLGWNINPGTITRNMRGVPDDFNGTDELVQTQVMKPNVTWGFSAGYDLELEGIKVPFSGSAGVSLDLSFNNYLGPAMGLGLRGTTGFKIAQFAGNEKSSSIGIGGGITADINSRSGLTFSGSLSLTANAFEKDQESFGLGARLGTSYNSRSGIKALQLSEQMSYNYSKEKVKGKEHTYTGTDHSMGITSSSTISFTKPSYIPSIRMPLANGSYSGHFQLGNALFGVYGNAEVEAYKQVSEVAQRTQTKHLVGYLYYQDAANDPNAVMDFTRLNDNEVTPNTTIISAPQYTYDVFSVQGEGTGGTIRAYRDDLGYVRDNITRSEDKSISGGADVGIPGHYGANFNIIRTPTVISEWNNGNSLHNTIGFTKSDELHESVYFRNPGEMSVLTDNQFQRIGGTDLVRFQLGGDGELPTIEPFLEQFSKTSNGTATGTQDVRASLPQYERKKRTQVISFLTADEAKHIGLDPTIKNYDADPVLDENNKLKFEDIDRESEYRRPHHISQINVTEANGKRYVYGIPVYNVKQEDFTFSVAGLPTEEDLVEFNSDDASDNPPLISNKTKDCYVQKTATPAYAHSFLLTGLLSPDYVDVTDNGITEDDLGDAVKFNYSKCTTNHRWRTPLSNQNYIANFNDGNRSETKDDKGIVSYGERESWYLHSIESKTMIALFTLEDRKDGKGVGADINNEQGPVSGNDNSQKRLQKIDLYNKSDLKKNGLTGARPIKTVWFVYSYSLCANTPDNTDQSETGKLTLAGIYFTFNGKSKANKNKYVFSYGNTAQDNPSYSRNASDRWGNYKPQQNNPETEQGSSVRLKNRDYPYSVQDPIAANNNAGAWSLKKILLPSGGQIEVEYESDDYAFVQNKRAATMMQVLGLGKDENTITNNLYGYDDKWKDNLYVFIKVPDANVVDVPNALDKFKKTYMQDFDQLAFKLAVNMPKSVDPDHAEYVNCYAEVEDVGKSNANNDDETIWVKLKAVPYKDDYVSPLTLSVLEYLREHLPGQAFRGYDVSETTGLKQIAGILGGMVDALKSAFRDPINFLRGQAKAQSIFPKRSFVRLTDLDGFKYGGGQRVRSVVLKDNWNTMTGQFTSRYGQQYDYKTTEIFNGEQRTISSGVASYEPSIGGEENPFYSIVQVVDKVPLGPASYGAIEMPVLDAFFPAPVVGYSKVTVRSIQEGAIEAGKKSRSGIGKQVTEFYTAKDFPVYYNHTAIDPTVDKRYDHTSLFNFFYKYSVDRRALSQGFIVETNDMHGKLKSQASYAEGDENTMINYTENFYRNTGADGLNDKFDFVHASDGGTIKEGNMGIDIELMTDAREFSVNSTSYEAQGQLDYFPVFGPLVWVPFFWQVAGNSENTYRAVTTTKVVNYHGLLDRVLVIDKGSMITTKNLVYDAETGDVVVNSTENEFDKTIYSVNYPAYWGYSGMGLAYKNIDATYNTTGVNLVDGKIVGGEIAPGDAKNIFESGDELLILDESSPAGCNPTQVGPAKYDLVWVMNKNKDNDNSSLTDPNPDLIFIDKAGNPLNRSGVKFRIVRSGKRNMLNASVASISTMDDPRATVGSIRTLVVNNEIADHTSDKVINASAVEYKDKWQEDDDVFYKYRTETNPVTCEVTEVPDCAGHPEKGINPYRKGLLGNFRVQRSKVFYGDRGSADERNLVAATNLSKNGFLADFSPYWDFDGGNLVPDLNNLNWVWNAQTTRFNSRGMELETKDALNIYTSAQYGYSKTLPTAITNNGRYDEMFYDGFEDYDYNDLLNNSSYNSCAQRHIDFSGLGSSQITDNIPFAAHTGKFVLSVPQGSAVTKQIPVASTNNYDYGLSFGSHTSQVLNEPGGNESFTTDAGTYTGTPTYNFSLIPELVTIDVFPASGNQHRYTGAWDSYIQVTTPGSYIFTMEADTRYNVPVNTQQPTPFMYFQISDLDGVSRLTFFPTPPSAPPYLVTAPSVFLCPGIYHLVGSTSLNYQSSVPTNGHDTYKWSCTNANFTNYKNLSTTTGCTYTLPIAGALTMQNPIFQLPAEKKILFGAWVRESNTNQTTYLNNEVQMDFGSGSPTTLQPTGPIIEGWQRYEGSFDVPTGVTQMNLKLVNNSSGTIYFDDIRIHPFNANMKSYVYDPVNLRLTAELDANNYASFYEYDDEGTLIRTKAETKQGVKTITETRSFKQTSINELQQ